MGKRFYRLLFLAAFAFSLSNCTTSFDEQLKNLDSSLKKTFKISDKPILKKNNKDQRSISESLNAETIEDKKVPQEQVKKPKKKDKTETLKITSNKIEKNSIKFLRPLIGEVLQPYKKGSNDGVDISAASGTAIKAVANGIVVAITVDTEQRSILILRHQGNLLTIYANISGITVKKGETVEAGQTIAKVSDGKPSFLHFEVREGLESVDPSKYF
jgi:murein DD-endopeptidase MepM/ murein hydrolase activator NlpD